MHFHLKYHQALVTHEMETHIKNVEKLFYFGAFNHLISTQFFHAQVCKFWPAYDAKKHN